MFPPKGDISFPRGNGGSRASQRVERRNLDPVNLAMAELRSAVTVLKGYSFLLATDWESLPEEERRELALLIQDSVKSINNMLRNRSLGSASPPQNVSVEEEHHDEPG